jgi:hypothetical protein
LTLGFQHKNAIEPEIPAVYPRCLPPMIECFPKSLCSWDFTATGPPSGTAEIKYDWLTEQGRILNSNMIYEVRKHGVFSGHWTMEHAGSVVTEAHKTSALFRTFDISSHSEQLTLHAGSAFTRAFEIVSGNQVLGHIMPIHPFTRRARIDCVETMPESIQLFCFWLAALTWRRSANNSAAAT